MRDAIAALSYPPLTAPQGGAEPRAQVSDRGLLSRRGSPSSGTPAWAAFAQGDWDRQDLKRVTARPGQGVGVLGGQGVLVCSGCVDHVMV